MAECITKTLVDKLHRGEIDSYVWDSDITGFGIKVTPKGRKVYFVQYRSLERKTRRVTIAGRFQRFPGSRSLGT